MSVIVPLVVPFTNTEAPITGSLFSLEITAVSYTHLDVYKRQGYGTRVVDWLYYLCNHGSRLFHRA